MGMMSPKQLVNPHRKPNSESFWLYPNNYEDWKVPNLVIGLLRVTLASFLEELGVQLLVV